MRSDLCYFLLGVSFAAEVLRRCHLRFLILLILRVFDMLITVLYYFSLRSMLISDASFAADITFEISLGRFETINCLLRMKS